MALPWLIGAAVLGVGALIAAVANDDESSSHDSSTDEERRRRKQAEHERREREKEEEMASLRRAFNQEGSQRSHDFQKLLSEWITVNYRGTSPFKGERLNTGAQARHSIDRHFVDSCELGDGVLNTETRENLNFFETCYEADLSMTERFYKAVDILIDIQEQKALLQHYHEQLELISYQLSRRPSGH